ncbi:MAG: hypothetical protein WC764_04720 [Candidatus Paceibacterota bacterium]|jgi:guanylate kinase
MKRIIVSVTGPTGSGKTSIARGVLKERACAFMVQSHTTRDPRPSDLPGEYSYDTPDEYAHLYMTGSFLWTAKHGSTCYGTTPEIIRSAYEPTEALGIMILVPEVIPLLWQFLGKIGKGASYKPFFIVPPERAVLEGRLRARGDKVEEIALRLDEAQNWYRDAKLSGIPYTYIRNDGAIETAVNEILKSIPA